MNTEENAVQKDNALLVKIVQAVKTAQKTVELVVFVNKKAEKNSAFTILKNFVNLTQKEFSPLLPEHFYF